MICTAHQIEKKEMGGHVARVVERRGTLRNLVENPEGKRPLGRSRRRWEDNIKMDLQSGMWGHGLD
jgi:hypothetical protein